MRFVIGLVAAATVAMTAGVAVSLAPSSPEQPPTTTAAPRHPTTTTIAGTWVAATLVPWTTPSTLTSVLGTLAHIVRCTAHADSYALVWIDLCWQRAAGHLSDRSRVRLADGVPGWCALGDRGA